LGRREANSRSELSVPPNLGRREANSRSELSVPPTT
jgi:hypothetical protein